MYYHLLSCHYNGKSIISEDELKEMQLQQFNQLSSIIDHLSLNELFELAYKYEYNDLINETFELSRDYLQDGTTVNEIRDRLKEVADIDTNGFVGDLPVNLYDSLDYPEIEFEEIEIEPCIENKMGSDAIVTRLPVWLNDWIKSKDAFYEVDKKQVIDGRFLNEYGVRWYLGSLFPKSFAEAYTIFEDLFANSYYHEMLKDKSELHVLDIGCGTGGNTIGLAIAIISRLPNVREIHVLGCDTCEESLKSMTELVEHFNHLFGQDVIEINLSTRKVVFGTLNQGEKITLSDFAKGLSDSHFDIILSFKMINELIRHEGFDVYSVYSEFAQSFCPLLSEVGTLTIEDVSDRINNVYLSKPFGQSINAFVQSTQGSPFRIISPLPCSIKQEECKNSNCYMQRRLEVKFESKYAIKDTEKTRVSEDIQLRVIDTLITYRILANKNLAESMRSPWATTYNYKKIFKRPDADDKNVDDHCCGNASGKIKDAFIIK